MHREDQTFAIKAIFITVLSTSPTKALITYGVRATASITDSRDEAITSSMSRM